MAVVTELGHTSSSTSVQGVTVTITSPGAAIGALVVVMATGSGSGSITAGSVTDTHSHTWALDRSGTWGSTDGRTGLWSVVLTTALSAGDHVTFNNGGGSFKNCGVYVIDTPSATPALDGSTAATGTGTSLATGTSGTTAQANEVVLATFAWTSNDAFTAPSGYSQPTTPVLSTTGATIRSCALTYKVVTATGTQAATATLAGSENWRASLTTYKVNAASGSYSETLPAAQIIYSADAIGDSFSGGGSASGALQEIGHNALAAAAQGVSATLSGQANVGDDVIVVALASGAGGIASANVSDSRLNTYTLDKSQSWGATDGRLGIWRAHVATALQAGDTVVFNNAGSSFKAIGVYAVSTPSADPSVDVTKSASGTGTAPATGTSTATTQAAEMVLAAFAWTGADAFTPPAGYTQPTTPVLSTTGATIRSLALCWKNITLTGTQAATATLAGSENWAAIAETLKMTLGGISYSETLPAAELIIDGATILDAYAGLPTMSETLSDALYGFCANPMVDAYSVTDSYVETLHAALFGIACDSARDSYTTAQTTTSQLTVKIAFATDPLDPNPEFVVV